MSGFPQLLLDRYVPARVLGVGSFATVWQARSVASGRDVAVKVLSEEHVDDPDAVARFLHEARVGARLRHPGIVPVLEHGVVDQVPYLVTPWIAGATLRQLVVRGALPVRQALVIGMRLASALSEIHRHGIVHRDLKPENILMPEPDCPVLLDFGFAKSADSALVTRRGIVVGTAGYVAPELFEGSGASSASDQYSLGVVLYELVVGSRPFARVSPADEVVARMTEPPVPPARLRPELSPLASDTLLRMLARRPRDRFGDLDRVSRALAQAARRPSQLPASASTDTLRLSLPARAARRPLRSLPWVLFLMGVSALILSLAGLR
ncbi:MAG: serine/threonine protein kinase [Candidatus Wallbacteria bacterium]|nr:serine/threonine protein kinase [Candidatus Wallbacteria bacterium]